MRYPAEATLTGLRALFLRSTTRDITDMADGWSAELVTKIDDGQTVGPPASVAPVSMPMWLCGSPTQDAKFLSAGDLAFANADGTAEKGNARDFRPACRKIAELEVDLPRHRCRCGGTGRAGQGARCGRHRCREWIEARRRRHSSSGRSGYDSARRPYQRSPRRRAAPSNVASRNVRLSKIVSTPLASALFLRVFWSFLVDATSFVWSRRPLRSRVGDPFRGRRRSPGASRRHRRGGGVGSLRRHVAVQLFDLVFAQLCRAGRAR